MDKRQLATMQMFGYSVQELPGKTIPKTTYYKMENGELVVLPGLPADSYHMERYLRRGFTLEPPPKKGDNPVGLSSEDIKPHKVKVGG